MREALRVRQNKAFISRPVFYLTVVFILSRILFFYAGVGFFWESLYFYMQFIDPALMQSKLLESVYYLQMQPPLFNLIIGCCYKLFGSYFPLAMFVFYTLMGAGIMYMSYFLMKQLGASTGISAFLAAIFIVSPQTICYERWLFYTYPVAFTVLMSACFLSRFESERKTLPIFFFFLSLTLLIYLRGTFHLLYFVFCAAGVFILSKNKKAVLTAAVIPFILCDSLYLKNWMLFSSFSATGTWVGLELSRMTVFSLPTEERKMLVNQGKISRQSLIDPYSEVKAFKELYPQTVAHKTGVQVLDRHSKSTGWPNYNHPVYILTSKQYVKDSLYVLPRYFSVYFCNWLNSVQNFLLPGPSKGGGEGNNIEQMKKISVYETWYNRLFTGRFKEGGKGWFLICGIPLLLIYCSFLTRKEEFKKRVMTLYFMQGTFVYVMLICTAMGKTLNNRYRFSVEVFIWVLAALFLTHLLSRFKKDEITDPAS